MTASPPAPVSPLQTVLADAGGGILETEVVRCPRAGMALSEATNLLMWSDRNTVAYRPPRIVSAGGRPDVQESNAKCSRLWLELAGVLWRAGIAQADADIRRSIGMCRSCCPPRRRREATPDRACGNDGDGAVADRPRRDGGGRSSGGPAGWLSRLSGGKRT